jgi:hypothetical protein
MEECKECVINIEKCCDECIRYEECKKTVDFVNPPDEYPNCWVCGGIDNDKCKW